MKDLYIVSKVPGIVSYTYKERRYKMNMLKGKKTYIVVIAGLVFAVSGVITGQLTFDQAMAIIFPLLGLGTVRMGMQNK